MRINVTSTPFCVNIFDYCFKSRKTVFYKDSSYGYHGVLYSFNANIIKRKPKYLLKRIINKIKCIIE